MKCEAIFLALAMTVATSAAALSAPTVAVGKDGVIRVEQGTIGAKNPAQPTDFEPGKNRQQWQDIPLPENLTRGRRATLRA